MTRKLQPPPVPAHAKLHDYDFTPIYRYRLFGSRFHASASDAEWRAGVTLWLKSWDQVPAGSLPDDDVALARLAELGKDVATWRKIRPVALKGWKKHSDKLLYHPVVTEGILRAISTSSKMSQRGKLGARKRWQNAHPESADGDGTSNAQAMLSDSNRRIEKERKRESKDIQSYPSTESDSESEKPIQRLPTSKNSTLAPSGAAPPPQGKDKSTRLDRSWTLPDEWRNEAARLRELHGLSKVNLQLEADKFRAHYCGKAGRDALRTDWRLTWIGWALRADPVRGRPPIDVQAVIRDYEAGKGVS